MNKKVMVVLGMVALLVIALIACQGEKQATVETGKAPFVTNLEEAQKLAKENNRNILIDFYTDWCYWCKVLDTGVMTKPEAIDFFTNDMVLARINAEVDTALSNKYYAKSFPTLLLINADGEEIDRITGYMELPEFLETLRNYEKGIGVLDDLLRQADTTENRDLFLEIANRYRFRGVFDQATPWFEKVIALGDPSDSLSAEARFGMAHMLRKAGKFEATVAAFEAIMKDFEGTRNGRDAEIWRAIMYSQHGDTTKAIELYEAFLVNHPEAEDTAYAREQIELLKNPPAEEKH